ncbi:MAG: LacI family transcriptional regulator [Halanaerobiales bacterium]|nr:LacI family transcriptional regulator [Halanaerobiales bacterium]
MKRINNKKARKRYKPPTMDDVAELAGVARSTVSNAINDTAPVSKEVKERIFKVIEELQYKPNNLARGLRSNRTQLIGLIIPDINNPFYSEISKGIEKYMNQKGFSVVLCNTDYDLAQEKKYLDKLIQVNVDGLIFITGEQDLNLIAEIHEKSNTRIVFTDRSNSFNNDIPIITIDHKKAMKDMTKYLIELGHKNIAYISEPTSMKTLRDRLEGYKEAFRETGISINNSLILIESVLQTNKIKRGYEITSNFLAQSPLIPTAIITTSDLLAIGAIKAIREKGYRVPDDMSVTGFDDIETASYICPGLTTIKQPLSKMGTLSAKVLVELINGNPVEEKQIILEHQLIARESTCRVKQK